MKKSIVLSALVVCLVFVACAQKPTVDDMVNKIVQAYGGKEKMASIQDQVATWDSQTTVPMGDSSMTMSGVMTITFKRPNKIKFESQDQSGAVVFSQVFDGTNGWVYMMGPTGPNARDMSPAEIQEMTILAETWVEGWHDYAAKGFKLAMLSDTTMNGKAYHRIHATDRFGNASVNYCDTQTSMMERTDAEMTDPMTMQKVPSVMTFTGYAAHDGWMMPQKVASYDASNNPMFEMALKEVKNNTGVADDTFVKPAPPMPEPSAENK